MVEISTIQAYLDRSLHIRWARPLHFINIIGVMGSGKTTLARKIYARYKWGKPSKDVVSVYWTYERSEKQHKKFFDAIKKVKGKKYVYVVIDDISFQSTHDRLTRNFLMQMARIRHLNPNVKRWVIVTIMHYSKGALPFLRYGHTKALTSLTDPEEIDNLRWSFTIQALWDYYDVYRLDPTGHWVLFNWLGNIFISKIHKPTKKCWDIVVTGPKCIE